MPSAFAWEDKADPTLISIVFWPLDRPGNSTLISIIFHTPCMHSFLTLIFWLVFVEATCARVRLTLESRYLIKERVNQLL